MDKNIDEFIKKSEKRLEELNQKLNNYNDDITLFINDKFINKISNKNIIINNRVKSKGSLREKILRKNYFIKYKNDEEKFIKELPDLIGIRLVCLLEKEEDIVFEEIKKIFSKEIEDKYFTIDNIEKEESYLKIKIEDQPDIQKNGHNIYKMDAKWVTADCEVNVEIQIKSLVHMFWGEIEHMLFYKNYAYTVDSDFYKNFMNSTFEILHNVDYQLEIIRDKLCEKSEIEEIEEIKRMATRILYNTYHENAYEIFGCNINLREAFELISIIYFGETTNKYNILNKFNGFISSINSRNAKLKELDYKFNKYNSDDCNVNKEIMAWCELISELINSKDVFWNTFFAVYKIIDKEEKDNTQIENISTFLSKIFNSYKDLFEEGIDGKIIMCSKGIEDGIFSCFEDYRKIDFFTEGGYYKEIKDNLEEFVSSNQEEMYSLNDNEYKDQAEEDAFDKNIRELIKLIIKIRLLLVLEKNIKTNDLKRIVSLLEMVKFERNLNIDICELENFISEKEVVVEISNKKEVNILNEIFMKGSDM